MDGKPKSSETAAGKDGRAERLAAALRANLKRRKQQARSRSAEGRGPEQSAEARAPEE